MAKVKEQVSSEQLRQQRDTFALELAAVLDEAHAPTSSGGITLSTIGRIRALRSKLVIEGNQRAGALEAELAETKQTLAAQQLALKTAAGALERGNLTQARIWLGLEPAEPASIPAAEGKLEAKSV